MLLVKICIMKRKVKKLKPFYTHSYDGKEISVRYSQTERSEFYVNEQDEEPHRSLGDIFLDWLSGLVD